MYYTENLNLIKANRLQGKTKGPYQFKPVGSPSETIDLRNSDCRIERLEDDATVFLMKHLGKVLEVKAQDEAQCERWLEVVQNIIDTERSKRKQVGTLKIAVDGCFLVGGRLASEGEEGPRHCCLSFKLRDETVTSDAAEIAVDDALSYENLDESHDAVGRAPVALEAELPIWQTSMAMEWKLSETGGHRKSEAPEGGHKKRRSSVAAFAAVVQSALATKEDDGPCVRTTTLFELQAENAITYMGAHRRYVASDAEQFDHATAASSLEGDVSADPFWPAFAPDGKAPKPGWRWYALYDRDVDEDRAEGAKDEDRPLRVRALLHAKLSYFENVINVVDPDGHPRYEAQDDHEEFKTDLLTGGMTRLSDVADDFAALGNFLGELLAWDKPFNSFVGWLVLAGSLVALPDHSALAMFPLLMLLVLVLGLPKALRGGRVRELVSHSAEDDAPGASHDREVVKRAIAEINVSVLKGRHLVAADQHLTTKHSSDPYCVVISLPPPPMRFADHKLSEMLIGVSSVKSKTLDPEWLNPGAAADAYDFGADDRASSSASSDSHLDSLLALLAPSLHNEGGAADVLGDVYDASASRNAAQLSAASVKYYGDCVPPPIDFRSKWRPGAYGGVPSEASWTYPVMQEVDDSGVVPCLVPWEDSKSAIAVEAYDKDVTQTDDFLGTARISLADLVAAESGVVVGWLPLELSGDAAKDATLLGAERCGIRPLVTSELSRSVTSMSIRLIFGRIDCSRRVLEAESKRSRRNRRAH